MLDQYCALGHEEVVRVTGLGGPSDGFRWSEEWGLGHKFERKKGVETVF